MYIVPYFNNRRETSKNDARYPIVYAAKSSLDPDGPSLALDIPGLDQPVSGAN